MRHDCERCTISKAQGNFRAVKRAWVWAFIWLRVGVNILNLFTYEGEPVQIARF